MKVIINNPKVQFIFFLILFFIVTMFHLPFHVTLQTLVLCVSFSALTDLLFTYLKKRRLFIPYSAIITGLILSLIIDPALLWFQIFVICAAAIGTKVFFRISARHVFNPAAIGLLAGWILFGSYPSWWAPTLYTGGFSIPNAAIYITLLLLSFTACYKYKKYTIIIIYLASFFILSLLFSLTLSVRTLIATILSSGMIFYAIVMLAEPMTSPVNKKRQAFYGFVVAFLYVLMVFIIQKSDSQIITNFPDPSLVALLVGNLLFFRLR